MLTHQARIARKKRDKKAEKGKKQERKKHNVSSPLPFFLSVRPSNHHHTRKLSRKRKLGVCSVSWLFVGVTTRRECFHATKEKAQKMCMMQDNYQHAPSILGR